MSTSVEPGNVPKPVASELDPRGAEELARQYGLRKMGLRPKLMSYVRSVWQRRSFIRMLALSKAYAANRASYLGQLWSVLNPTLNALVYILIFGFLMGTRTGIANVVAFIVVGTFMWGVLNHTVIQGAKAIDSNLGLVRSMRFPRAVLPISTALTQFLLFLPTVVVMIAISWLSGFLPKFASVPITWKWLLLPAAIVLFGVFNIGLALFLARIATGNPDVTNVLPFVVRLLMYVSGVIFSIPSLVHNHLLVMLLEHQPAAVYLYLARMCLLAEEPSVPWDPVKWLWGIGWALAMLVVGFILFWRKEEKYGRD